VTFPTTGPFEYAPLRSLATRFCKLLSPNRDANNRALREAIDVPDIQPNQHAAAIAAIALRHSVFFKLPDYHDSRLCLPYALGLYRSDVHFNVPMMNCEQRMAARLIGCKFANWLLDGRLKRRCLPKKGRLIMYFDAQKWRHAGRLTARDVVMSKWGEYPV
jgi:hypothetical protein